MSSASAIRTFFQGQWQEGNVPVLGSADHGTWLGTLVFDGARQFDGVCPDLQAHCERVNRSAESLGMTPTMDVTEIMNCVTEGLSLFDDSAAIYIRPMYWSTGYGDGFISADPSSTAFCLCLQEIAMPDAEASARLTTTKFHRPTLEVATVNAKAACLYPNNARMIREAYAKGFTNALVCDSLGNVAESATSNVFLVRDGEAFTPIPNGSFLNGITRQRIMILLDDLGIKVHETTLTYDDFHAADEVFLTGNLSKVTPVTAFDDTEYKVGDIALKARAAYMDWARS
ncbi:MAG: branched-chain amino acid aminotransferase [Granulosicoccus sp.]